MINPSRGEVWFADLEPTRGREQAGQRPVLVISAAPFNHSLAGLVIVLPITTKAKGIPYHIEINPPEGGLMEQSFVKCEDVRSITKERLSRRWGEVSSATLTAIEDRLRILLDL
ncbi:type II toxin-antitoxin system PemK/MazF family toxin [Candidatus Poribacteria bacterium]|nr:type II toxin-antitoxin system PemK/MazF family toxin [Candidatus Poribacteria bacterium]